MLPQALRILGGSAGGNIYDSRRGTRSLETAGSLSEIRMILAERLLHVFPFILSFSPPAERAGENKPRLRELQRLFLAMTVPPVAAPVCQRDERREASGDPESTAMTASIKLKRFSMQFFPTVSDKRRR
ncbi:hypothetical protein MTO96_020610 [Rhipicephalus appendiculatus]